MRTIITLLLAAIAMVTISCSKQKNMTGDYIIIGHVGGFAGIADYYIISNGQLKRDTVTQQVPDDISKLKFDVVMPDARYQKVAHLKESIPGELLNQNNKSFGEVYPDAMGLEVYTTINGTKYHWSFVGNLSKTSAAIQKFTADAEKVFY